MFQKIKSIAITCIGCALLSSIASAQNLKQNLVGYYRFEKNFKDTSNSGSVNHGTTDNAPEFQVGINGHSIKLRDQLNPRQAISLGSGSDFQFGSTTDFTVSIWFKHLGKMHDNSSIGGGTNDPILIGSGNWTSSNNVGWYIYADANGGLGWNLSDGTRKKRSEIINGFGPNGVADGRWHHVVVTNNRDGNATYYIDGKNVGQIGINDTSFFWQSSNAIGSINTGLPTVIGADGNKAYGYRGGIDEAAIWRRVLTSAEVSTLYHNTKKGISVSGDTIVDADGDGMDDDWEQSTFGTTTYTADQDTDGDGRSNFLEYAQGTDPKKADPTSLEISEVEVGGNTYPLVSYVRPALISSSSYKLEVTSNMTQWNSGNAYFIQHAEPTDLGGGKRKYYFRHNVPIQNGQNFFRLRITESYQDGIQENLEPTLEMKTGSAFVRWKTDTPSATILEYGKNGVIDTRYENFTLKTDHEVEITNLQNGQVVIYRVVQNNNGQETVSNTMESSRLWDYSPASVPNQGSYVTPGGWGAKASEILALSGAPNAGYCLDYNCRDGKLAFELARQSQLVIFCVENTQAEVDAARAFLTARGVYGSRVQVILASDLSNLPVLEDTFNLVVSQAQIENEISYAALKTAVEKHAVPKHGMVAGYNGSEMQGDIKAAATGTDEWTHQNGNGANKNANDEELGNKENISGFELKWIGRPGPEIVIDRMVRAPSPLAANGRFYCQGLGRLLALDSNNGSVIWTRDIRDVHRLNMIRDASNFTAADEGVYMAVRDQCWLLDKDTGARTVYNVVDSTLSATNPDFEYEWGYISSAGNDLIGSATKKGSFYKDFWGQEYWFDAQSGNQTYQVCSDNIFSLNRSNGQTKWTYDVGTILNVTITIADGKIFFLESRSSSARNAAISNLPVGTWKSSVFLVCLDLDTGVKLWDKSISPSGGEPCIWLQHDNGKLILTGSEQSNDTFYIQTYDASNGNTGWSASHGWQSSHHGGNHQIPVISQGFVHLEPHKYSLSTGARVSSVMPTRVGCSGFRGSKNLLFFRGLGQTGQYAGNIALWHPSTSQTSSVTRVRPGCWLSYVPANGMLLVQEQGAGCSCGSWMETSFGLAPKKN